MPDFGKAKDKLALWKAKRKAKKAWKADKKAGLDTRSGRSIRREIRKYKSN